MIGSVRSKLLTILVLISALIFALAIFAVTRISRVARTANLIIAERVPIELCAQHAQLAVVSGAGYVDKILLIQNYEEVDEIRALEGGFRETMIEFDMFIKAMLWGSESDAFKNSSGGLTFAQWKRRGSERNPVVKQAPHEIQQLAGMADIYYAGFSKYARKVISGQRRILRLELSGKVDEIPQEKDDLEENIERANRYKNLTNDSLERAVSEVHRYMETAAEEINRTRDLARVALMGFSVLIFSLSLLLGIFFSNRVILRPIKKLHKGIEIIGGGNLDHKLSTATKDEIGQLSRAFDKMAEDLKGSTTSIVNLNKQIAERKRAEEALQQRTHDLGERVKELNCLYGASKLMAGPYKSLDDVFQEIARLIPPAWQYPDITCARISFEGRHFKTDNFKETAWKQSTDIRVFGENAGSVEVYYLEEKPSEHEGPFLKEEGDLINALATELGRFAERNTVEEERAKYAQLLEGFNAELGRSNRDLQDFTYAVSHDLQEPLRKVHTFGQFLVEDCGDEVSEKGRDHIRRMQDATLRMKELINHLLELSRVGTRGGELVPVNSRKVVESAIENLSERIRECDAEVGVDDNLPMVMTDRVQLAQVFQNLIGNALKFRSPDRPPRVKISARVEDEVATFSVEDDGIGVEERFLEKIFAVFQRLHPRDEYEGVGVGLALCRKIIRRHRGRIWAESEVGKGTTIRFTLPTAPQKRGEGDGG